MSIPKTITWMKNEDANTTHAQPPSRLGFFLGAIETSWSPPGNSDSASAYGARPFDWLIDWSEWSSSLSSAGTKPSPGSGAGIQLPLRMIKKSRKKIRKNQEKKSRKKFTKTSQIFFKKNFVQFFAQFCRIKSIAGWSLEKWDDKFRSYDQKIRPKFSDIFERQKKRRDGAGKQFKVDARETTAELIALNPFNDRCSVL